MSYPAHRPQLIWPILFLILITTLFGPTILNNQLNAREVPLFSSASRPTKSLASKQSLIRQRYVHVHPEVLPNNSVPITFELFDGLQVTAVQRRVDHYENGAYVWVGRVPNAPHSDITISVNGEVMRGTFNLGQRLIQLRYVGEGVHALEEVRANERQGLPPREPLSTPPTTGEKYSTADQTEDTAVDDGSVIDVMVLYTPKARQRVGGTLGMQALINTAFSESNSGLGNSNVDFVLNKAYTAEIAYNEVGDFYTDLDYLTFKQGSSSDPSGIIDNIHTLRDIYKADLTVLIIDGQSFCGLAWLMPTLTTYYEAQAFSVVDYSCATGHYSFAHEIGHNMGSDHNRSNSGGSPLFNYSYGYQDEVNSFRTIMAYNCPSSNCNRVNHWSNPDINYSGATTGVEAGTQNAADNHLSLSNAAFTVANFRVANTDPVSPTPTPTSTPLPTAQATISNSSGGVISAGSTTLTIPPNAFSETIVMLYRALAVQAVPPPPAHLSSLDHQYELTAVYESSGAAAELEPGKTYSVMIKYGDESIATLKESTLALYYWDGVQWQQEPTSAVNMPMNMINANPSHLMTNGVSRWAVLGESERVYLPFVGK